MAPAEDPAPCFPEAARGLPWPERTTLAVGLFAVAVGVTIALQRHQFTQPSYEAAVIALVVAPWVLDMLGWPPSLLRSEHNHVWLLVAWSVIVLGGVFWLIHTSHTSNDFAPFMLTVLIGEMAAVSGPWFASAVWATAIGELIVFANVYHYSGMYIWGFAFTIGWMGGAAFRQQVVVTYQLEQAQSRLAARAVEEERHRLARDVHDLIAHSLAVTMLQLSGARLALKAGDTFEAIAALEDAEAAGRSAMAEIHRTVGLLGSSDSDPTSSAHPTPRAADLPGLVSDFRRAGLGVEFALEGDLDAVPLATGLASYRLVQESLANAVKHAPGAPVELWVGVTDRDITIKVVNPVVSGAANRSTGGNGLRGMAERAELLGGMASASNGNGTWNVEACIPWQPAST
jgi:signal transduction histidine kinase